MAACERVVGWALVALSMVAGCGDTVVERREPLARRGAELARSQRASGSRYNLFACATCHAERPEDVGTRVLPGAPLQGAARRPSYWGGSTVYLPEAVERCWTNFMRGDPLGARGPMGEPLGLEGPDGEAIFAYLDALAPEGSAAGVAAVPMTYPPTVRDLPDGDAAAGPAAWDRACGYCHGAAFTGAGRLGELVSVLPRDTIREHGDDTREPGVGLREYLRTVTVEKVRHGSFLGYAGSMPPFSNEALSDRDLANIIAYFNYPDE